MGRAGGLLLALSLSGPALAEECGWIDAFVKGAEPPDAARCEDGVCIWRFDYRSSAAHDHFEDVGNMLAGCLGPHEAGDDAVNHPDSYELRQYEAGVGTVFLSIKDKAALQQTLVFLRVGRAP